MAYGPCPTCHNVEAFKEAWRQYPQTGRGAHYCVRKGRLAPITCTTDPAHAFPNDGAYREALKQAGFER